MPIIHLSCISLRPKPPHFFDVLFFFLGNVLSLFFCFQETINIDEPFLLRICALHRVPPEWDHDEYKVSLQIYHGTRPIVEPLQTEHRSLLKEESGMGNDRVVFDQYLETEESNVKIISLPREARIVLTLSSKIIVTEEKQRKVVTRYRSYIT